MKRNVLCALISAALMISICACKNKEENLVPEEGSGEYTYRTTLSSPASLSPTDFTSSSESTIIDLLSSSMYTLAMNQSKDGYNIVCELASELPADVTTEYAGKSPYSIPKGATQGYAWKFSMRRDACWEDGTPINADTVEYSLRQYLSPDMKNFHATDFYDTLPIANAKTYFQGSETYTDIFDLETKIYASVPEHEMYVSLTRPVAFFGDSVETYRKTYSEHFFDEDGTDLYEALRELTDEKIYAPLTENMKPIMLKIAKSFGDTNPDAYKEFCFSKNEKGKTAWESVGFIKDDDYTYTLILSRPTTSFMAVHGTNIPLIHEPLYEACKTNSSGIIRSSYGTSSERMISYGPYKIASFKPGQSITLERNQRWYGWSDGKHDGQFQTTKIDIQFVGDHTTERNLFAQGKLDAISASSADLSEYPVWAYKEESPSPYTYTLSLNSDKTSLKRRENPGVNKRLLSYTDFRRGLSLCIDRDEFVHEIAPNSSPAYTLISRYYIGVPETGKPFVDTKEALDVREKIDMDIYSSSKTMFNCQEARECFVRAYEDALKAGDIQADDRIEIEMHAASDTEQNQKTAIFIQNSIEKACEGTALAGRIKIMLVANPDLSANIKKGLVDMAITKNSSLSFNPYGILSQYCTPSLINEYGYNPLNKNADINLGGERLSLSLLGWNKELNLGTYHNAAPEVKNKILAEVEKSLLESYCVIPVRTLNSVRMISQRIQEGSDHFINPVVEFGGIRFMQYTMDDAEWNAFCKGQMSASPRNAD